MNIPKRFPAYTQDRLMAYSDCVTDPMIQLELEFAEQLDVTRLTKAIELSFDAEPILGCRYVSHWRKPYWERLARSKREILLLTNDEGEYEAFKSRSIDGYIGPQIQACILRSSAGDHLLLKVSHIVCDAGGVKEIMAIISDLYTRLVDDPNYRPEPNLKGSRGIWQVIRHMPWYAYFEAYFRFVRDNWAHIVHPVVHTLPIDNGPHTPLTFVRRFLPKEQISYLIEYGQERNATLNDMMQTAFIRALVLAGNWNGRTQLRSVWTMDFRRYLHSGRGEAIATLSGGVFCHLGTNLGNDFDSTLARVTAITQRQKVGWTALDFAIGTYSFIRLLPDGLAMRLYQGVIQRIIKKHNFLNTLTNMGPIDPESVAFDSRPLNAWLWCPPGYPPWFWCGLSGYAGTLTLTASVYPTQKDIVKRFFDLLLAEFPVENI